MNGKSWVGNRGKFIVAHPPFPTDLGRRSVDELKDNFKEDFWEAFPPPMDYPDLLMVLEKYIKNVEDMVKQLEAWFPPSSVPEEI